MTAPIFQELPVSAHVLFIRLRNLGEAVLDTANLRALKRQRPDLQIATLVEAIYTDLYEADPDLEAIPLTRSGQDKRSSIASRLSIIKTIRQRNFSAVINLHGGPTSAHLTFLSGAKYRLGAEHFRNGYAYNKRFPPSEKILGRTNLHTVEYQFGWFKWCGLAMERPMATQLFVAPNKRAAANQKLQAAGVNLKQPYVVLAPTNEFYTKRWLPERYGALAEKMVERGYQVVLTGAPTAEQISQIESVQQATTRKLTPLTDLNIGELMAVIADAKVFIGNDSGPAHIAAAVQTPLVVLFGPASSERWRPWAENNAELVQNYFACNPCAMYTCTEFSEPECIRSISLEHVLKAIDRVLL